MLIFTAERPNAHISDRIPYPCGEYSALIRSGYKGINNLKKIINYCTNILQDKFVFLSTLNVLLNQSIVHIYQNHKV